MRINLCSGFCWHSNRRAISAMSASVLTSVRFDDILPCDACETFWAGHARDCEGESFRVARARVYYNVLGESAFGTRARIDSLFTIKRA